MTKAVEFLAFALVIAVLFHIAEVNSYPSYWNRQVEKTAYDLCMDEVGRESDQFSDYCLKVLDGKIPKDANYIKTEQLRLLTKARECAKLGRNEIVSQ